MDKSCEKNRHKTDRYYQLAKNQSQQQTKQKDVLQLCSALYERNIVAIKIIKYLLLLILCVVLTAIALFKWEHNEANTVLASAIESMVSGKIEPDIKIVFQERALIPDLSSEYEIQNYDNLLLWGYEYQIKFHSGQEVSIDVIAKIFDKSEVYVYFKDK